MSGVRVSPTSSTTSTKLEVTGALLHPRATTRRHDCLALPGVVQRLVDAEARRRLARRELLEGLEEFPDDGLRGHEQKCAVSRPFCAEYVGVLGDAFKGVAAKVVDLRYAQRYERILPNAKTMRTLLHERRLPIPDAQRHQIAVVTPVEESFTRVLLDLPFEERQQVVAVDVDLEGLVARLVALLELFDGIRFSGQGGEC